MTTIKIKKGAGTPSGLTFGELAYDVTNKKLFIGITGGNALLANTDGGVASFNGLTGAITGVASIRGLTGAVGITNGTGIGLSVSGQTMTFSNTGVLSVNGSTGTITNIAKTDVNNQFTSDQSFNSNVIVSDGTIYVYDSAVEHSISLIPSTDRIRFYDDGFGNSLDLYAGGNFNNQVIDFPGSNTTLAGLAVSQTFTGTNTFNTLTNFLSGISAGGVTFSGTLKGVTANFTGLVSSTVGFSGPGTNITGLVSSFNGLTGAVTGVSRVNGFTGGITFAASTGITFTASAGTITLSTTGGGGSKTYAVYTPLDNQPPAANYATIDTRNSIMVLDFDAATDESAVFVGIIPEAASLGSGLKIRINWMATSATSGTCRWGVQIERMNTDEDSDSFDTAATAGSTTNATSGIITTTEITITTIDSVVAGDPFRIKVFRDADGTSGTDDMTGDAELVSVEVRSAA